MMKATLGYVMQILPFSYMHHDVIPMTKRSGACTTFVTLRKWWTLWTPLVQSETLRQRMLLCLVRSLGEYTEYLLSNKRIGCF